MYYKEEEIQTRRLIRRENRFESVRARKLDWAYWLTYLLICSLTAYTGASGVAAAFNMKASMDAPRSYVLAAGANTCQGMVKPAIEQVPSTSPMVSLSAVQVPCEYSRD